MESAASWMQLTVLGRKRFKLWLDELGKKHVKAPVVSCLISDDQMCLSSHEIFTSPLIAQTLVSEARSATSLPSDTVSLQIV